MPDERSFALFARSSTTAALLTGLLLVAVAPAVDRTVEVEAPGTCEPADLTLHARLDPEELVRGGSEGAVAHLRLEVEGTDAPVRIELVNRTPGVVALEGGEIQVSHTTGGADNHLARALLTHRAGDFQIHYRLAPRPCP